MVGGMVGEFRSGGVWAWVVSWSVECGVNGRVWGGGMQLWWGLACVDGVGGYVHDPVC
jgi:hypothetical protein